MRPPRKSIQSRIAGAAALGVIAISGMVLAGCGGGGPEGETTTTTTKAAPARNAAPEVPGRNMSKGARGTTGDYILDNG